MTQLGSTPETGGTAFALYSSIAEAVELCFFDAAGRQTWTHFLSNCDDGVWHDFMPGCEAGQRYGYRVHGPFRAEQGLRCNPAKLLVDPYARQIEGDFIWHEAVFDSRPGEGRMRTIDTQDSAPYVPLSVVTAKSPPPNHQRPRVPWKETIFYESNVRGYTMRHPGVPENERGKFAGMRNAQVLKYLRALGVTAIELMPIQAFIDEHHLAEQNLRNFWGYNTINFFAPMPRYGGVNPLLELEDMVRAIHDAGMEVVLDVAYNHTGESGFNGPTVSFRGIDNLCYYRVDAEDPSTYINDTGCGNTVNVDHPEVRRMIVDSLGYFAEQVGVDGFRFDLATILGRHAHGFSNTHPLLGEISNEPRLKDLKLIAEPWDPGPGGYQLGEFPPRWAEWNDQYRDTVRKFWRGDHGASGALAQRMHGSADVFEFNGRPPFASVNFVSSHDGYTLSDVVSYEQRHNEANGEDNRDGHSHNYSCNYGHEGDSDESDLQELRRRQRLNILATLLFSQGTPMLLAGDEFGNSQNGNNNAYAQDNEIGWLDWSGLDSDPDFIEQVRELIWLRRETALLRIEDYVHDSLTVDGGNIDIGWINAAGEIKNDHEWFESKAFTLTMSARKKDGTESAVAISINSHHEETTIRLPPTPHRWRVSFSNGVTSETLQTNRTLTLSGRSIALLKR
jgi:isoamylase